MRVLRFILEATKPYRLYLVGIVAMMVIVAIDANVKPYLIKFLIDSAVNPSAVNIWYIVIAFAVFEILKMAAWSCSDWLIVRFYSPLRVRIISLFTDKISNYPYVFFQNKLSGCIVSKIGDAFNYIHKIIFIVNYEFIQFALTVIITLILLFYVHVLFALGLLLWIVTFLVITYFGLRNVIPLSKTYAEAKSSVFGHLADYLANILNVKLFGRFNFEKQSFQKSSQVFIEKAQAEGYYLMNFYIVQGVIVSIYTIGFLIFLIHLNGKNIITPGDFTLVFMLNFRMFDRLYTISHMLRDFVENWGAVDQALLMLEDSPEIQDKPDACELSVKDGCISFENVKFHYSGAEAIFQNKSITIEAGQKVGLVGYSGGGKSTFVNLIIRLYDVSKGHIEIDGQNIKDVTQDSLRSAIGMVPQDPSLFHRSLMDNIRYGLIDASDVQVVEAAKRAHAHEFITKLPQGYDSLVGERGVKLSGGQRQRIAIARAILKNAPILILDEATSQLDSLTEIEIQESLWELMQGKTSIVIAHRLSTLLHMDRILVFDKGKIMEDGTHQELLAKGGLYKALWDAQIGGFLPDADF